MVTPSAAGAPGQGATHDLPRGVSAARADDPVVAELLASQRAVFAARKGHARRPDGPARRADRPAPGADRRPRGAAGRQAPGEIALVADELADLRQLSSRDLVPAPSSSPASGRPCASTGRTVTSQPASPQQKKRGGGERGGGGGRPRRRRSACRSSRSRKEFQRTVLDEISELQDGDRDHSPSASVAADDQLTRVALRAPESGHGSRARRQHRGRCRGAGGDPHEDTSPSATTSWWRPASRPSTSIEVAAGFRRRVHVLSACRCARRPS